MKGARIEQLERQLEKAARTETHFPLIEAVMCVWEQCEAVFQEGPDRCPSCGSGTLIYLSAWVQPGQAREELDETRRALREAREG